MLRKVVAKFRVRNPVHLPSLKIQMLGKILKLQIFTWKFVHKKACPSVFHTHQSACELSLWSLSYRSSKINTGRQDWGLGSGFDRDPLDLDRPGRQLHQQDYARQGWAAERQGGGPLGLIPRQFQTVKSSYHISKILLSIETSSTAYWS